jgi:uncharacterized RDD family membrane protein YckC
MSNSVQYAGFWMRFLAVIIDGIILNILHRIIIIPILGAIGFVDNSFAEINKLIYALMQGYRYTEEQIMAMVFSSIETVVPMMVVSMIVSGVITILYYSFMESSKYQATLGKMALGLKVTDENGNNLGFAKCVIRQIGKYVSSIILMIGYIMAGFTSKKQALHDIMAGALVVKK